MADPFIGEIRLTPYGYAPRGWALCAGQLLSIQQNPALFSLLGTTYGGNGLTNFALPDLRGRVIAHRGSSIVLGQQAGEESHALLISEIPPHTHSVGASLEVGTSQLPDGGVPSVSPTGLGFVYTKANPSKTLAADAIQSAGNNQPHENRMPSLALDYIIALTGIFPSRN